MSAYHRYSFTKSVYPNYIILLVKKDRYYSFGIDRRILEYIKFKNKLFLLDKKRINYLVLDELDIVKRSEFVDNQIEKYLYLVYLNDIFKQVKVVMSYKYDLL